MEFYESTTVYMYMSSTELNVPVISKVKFAFENYLRIHIDFQSIFLKCCYSIHYYLYITIIFEEFKYREVDTLCNKLIQTEKI